MNSYQLTAQAIANCQRADFVGKSSSQQVVQHELWHLASDRRKQCVFELGSYLQSCSRLEGKLRRRGRD